MRFKWNASLKSGDISRTPKHGIREKKKRLKKISKASQIRNRRK